MSVSGSSSSSRSLAVLVASSRCFLRPSEIGSRMRGCRMALKMSLSPSMATKWRLALRQAWTEAPAGNQESSEQKTRRNNHKATIEFIKIQCTCGCSAIKNYVADLLVDSMSNWRRRGSFSLPPLQGVLPLMS
jgi:hypothetical protein